MKPYLFIIIIVLAISITFSFVVFADDILNSRDEEKSYEKETVDNQKENSVTETSDSSSNNQPKKVPLSEHERQIVRSALLSSQFVKDIPENNPISIRFYYFENGSRVWQDRFYMAEGKIIEKTSTGMEIIMSSEYIGDLEEKEICSVVKEAKSNGDLGLETEYSKSKLMWKYRSMMEHRDCFGV